MKKLGKTTDVENLELKQLRLDKNDIEKEIKDLNLDVKIAKKRFYM